MAGPREPESVSLSLQPLCALVYFRTYCLQAGMCGTPGAETQAATEASAPDSGLLQTCSRDEV